jgi:glycosyltransferase involved in cell wall biosynthesis
VPVLLWYAHSSVSPTLRIAHRLADRCVTSTPAAFRLPSSKLFVIGQGIDTDRFAPPAETGPGYERTLVSVGRLSPVKRVDEMIEALAVLEGERSLGLRLEVIGAPATPGDRAYAETLRGRVSALGLEDRVAFHGSVPYGDVARQYHRGAIFLNLTPSSLDKTILESMASGCVPVSRNPGFAEIARTRGLEQLVPADGAAGVAAAVAQVVEADATSRAELSGRLRGIVVQDHSLSSLGDRIVSHLEQLAAPPTNGRNGS